MSYPVINELREGASIQSNWTETNATRMFYLLYEDIPSEGIWTVHEDMKTHLGSLSTKQIFIPVGNAIFQEAIPCFSASSQHLLISGISIDQEGVEPKYIARCEYSVPPAYGAPAGYLPPWVLPWDVKIGFTSVGFTPTHTDVISVWNATGERGDTPSYGASIVNSAGAGFDPPPEEEMFAATLTFKGARHPGAPGLTVQDVGWHIGSINGDGGTMYPDVAGSDYLQLAGNVFRPYTCRIRDLSIEPNIWEDIPYQEINVVIEVFDPPWLPHPSVPGGIQVGWFRTYIDQGPYWIDETGARHSFTIGDSVTDVEQQLNGFGQPRGWNYDSGEVDPVLFAGEGPTFIMANSKRVINFAELGLPRTIGGWS